MQSDTHRLILALSPSKNTPNVGEGPLFCTSTGDPPDPGRILLNPQFMPSPATSQEVTERELTFKALRQNNQEMENILDSLRTPRTEGETLGKPLHLTFKDVTSEMTIILIPQELNLINLEIVPPSPMTGNFYKTKISPFLRKNPQRRGPQPREREMTYFWSPNTPPTIHDKLHNLEH